MKAMKLISVLSCEFKTDPEKKTNYWATKYLVKDKVKVGDQEVETAELSSSRSPVELKPGEHVVDIQIFYIDGKEIVRIEGLAKDVVKVSGGVSPKTKS